MANICNQMQIVKLLVIYQQKSRGAVQREKFSQLTCIETEIDTIKSSSFLQSLFNQELTLE